MTREGAQNRENKKPFGERLTFRLYKNGTNFLCLNDCLIGSGYFAIGVKEKFAVEFQLQDI